MSPIPPVPVVLALAEEEAVARGRRGTRPRIATSSGGRLLPAYILLMIALLFAGLSALHALALATAGLAVVATFIVVQRRRR